MIKVLIADDHPLMRRGIRNLLEAEQDMSVVGEAGDGEEAIELVSRKGPDVVLMDVGMPKIDGLTATRRIKAESPYTNVLVLTIHDEQEYVDGLLKAGANGYVLKSSYGPNLVEAIRAVSLGHVVLDPGVSEVVLQRLSQAIETVEGEAEGLSRHQVQLLRWMSQGTTSKEMARRLGVSERTIKAHVSRILDRLGVATRAAAVAAAIRRGVLSSDEA